MCLQAIMFRLGSYREQQVTNKYLSSIAQVIKSPAGGVSRGATEKKNVINRSTNVDFIIVIPVETQHNLQV